MIRIPQFRSDSKKMELNENEKNRKLNFFEHLSCLENALAYFSAETKKKGLDMLTPGTNVMKLFSLQLTNGKKMLECVTIAGLFILV